LQSIKKLGAAARATTGALSPVLHRHRAITRIVVATLSLGIALAVSLEGASAGPIRPPALTPPASLLPQNVGVGVLTKKPIAIRFAEPMDHASVAEALSIRPAAAFRSVWLGGRTLLVAPAPRWQTDARYVISVGPAARAADGSELGTRQDVSFTTQTAPIVADFELNYLDQPAEPALTALSDTKESATSVEPDAATAPDTASLVSTGTSITIGFSAVMDRADVERHLVLTPQVAGDVSWSGNSLVFTPSVRLEANARYALTVTGARDALGNPLSGDASFSFTTRVGAQVVKIAPLDGAKDVTPTEVSLWFSQPMDVEATTTSLVVTDATSDATLVGTVTWNERRTQLRFAPSRAFTKGHLIRVSFADGAQDIDLNAVTGTWSFRTKAPPPPPKPAVVQAPVSGPAAPADAVQFALWQINQARAAYGFGPLSLDSAISGVASAHAWDMMNYGYFSHTGRDGSTVRIRLSRAGINYNGWAGENLCYLGGGPSLRGALEWCHATFMGEPYPGYANHKGNILGSHFSRVGIGIATSGGKVIVVWDFAG
jgi:uncharacterized protein YkwD